MKLTTEKLIDAAQAADEKATALSAEAMIALGATRDYSNIFESFYFTIPIPRLWNGQVAIWAIVWHDKPMLNNCNLMLSNSDEHTFLPGVRTVGDLRQLYQMLMGKELK